MSEYIINKNTLIILEREGKSIVYEGMQTLKVNNKPLEIIKNSCEYYGSSYEGRIKGTKKLIGVSYKAPIIINESQNLVMFPTTSPKDNLCMWISLNNINNYYMLPNFDTLIIFNNKQEITINLSLGIFDKQYLRSTRLLNVLNSRKS